MDSIDFLGDKVKKAVLARGFGSKVEVFLQILYV